MPFVIDLARAAFDLAAVILGVGCASAAVLAGLVLVGVAV